MKSDCYRVNCIYRHLAATQDSKICHEVEELQLKENLAGSPYFISESGCLNYLDSMKPAEKPGNLAVSDLDHDAHLRIVCQTIKLDSDTLRLHSIQPQQIQAAPGETVVLKYSWAGKGFPLDLRAFVNFIKVGEKTSRFRDDHEPEFSTSKWEGQIEYTRKVEIPPSTPPGEYQIFAGFLDSETQAIVGLEAASDIFEQNDIVDGWRMYLGLGTPAYCRRKNLQIGTLRVR